MADDDVTPAVSASPAEASRPGAVDGRSPQNPSVEGAASPTATAGTSAWGEATAPAEPAPEDLPENYPSGWEADVVLRDGTVAHVRPIVPADAEGIRAFHAQQSEESIYLRFFAPIKEISARDMHRFTHVDYDSRAAIVATSRDVIVGIARYDRLQDPSVAEVAFNISDHYQGKGVGSVLLEHLAAIAQERGVGRFVADVLPQNRKMMNVFVDAGYEVSHHFDDGVIAVEFTIEPTEKSKAVQLAREHRAEAQSMARVLRPASIAVVGASRRPDAIGSLALDSILDGGFAGDVHLVNSETDSVRGLPAHSRVSHIEGGVDMAVIAVPADRVLDVVDDCAAAGVASLVVISSGFAEAGPVGEERQAELLRRARENGMRVFGPNSFGVVNHDPQVRLSATIARHVPAPGSLGLFSQSGGVGVGLLASVARRRLGVSVFASAGNRVDVSGNDLMQYFIDDDQTTTVGLFLESVGNARKFSRIARQLAMNKPVVAVKTGTSGTVPPGHRARASQVGQAAFHSLLAQAGVIRAASIHELVDIAELVEHQPLPAGSRIAVVGNSLGLNAIVADAAHRAGLEVTHGPVALPTGCDATGVAAATEAAFTDPEVDSVIVAVTSPMKSSDEEVASAIAHTAWPYGKPCIATFFGLRDVTEIMHRAGRPRSSGGRYIVPVYKTPLDGIAALGAVTRYALWRQADHGEVVLPDGITKGAARRLVDRVLAETPAGRALHPEEVTTLLAAYGLDVWPMLPVASPEEAVDAARRLEGTVVVRSMLPAVRTLPGSVRGGLTDDAAVAAAYTALAEQLSYADDPMLVVQQMAPVGVATLVRSVEDPLFGPVVSFGVAGATSELLDDVSHRIPPLTDVDARGLLTDIASAPLLQGYRGTPAANTDALVDVLFRVAALADDIPEVAHLELHPVNAHPGGADVLGAEVVLAPANARTDAGRRALT
ncbi:bifunctional acetate--CoA ligase family protein/GNAT family N-acetyltransferase [Mobilicoccus pelagius]|uniref:Putative acetate--CoA ligase n=1 Tax=Mobilicoccus pelagius NBRC 104925 TaxID=1089455 RepID=H5UUN4_9MICO|nr:GNAT family N-acetyltransferase [Mobilicoccus pelagius]GAB49442.1 putative acetate--CoA ligase [Mobilicoccus pelagius NBRC 104925]